jgi:hypothetical protein
MTTVKLLVGAWLAANGVIFAALMTRRSRPRWRAGLFRWIVDSYSRPRERGRNYHAPGRRRMVSN